MSEQRVKQLDKQYNKIDLAKYAVSVEAKVEELSTAPLTEASVVKKTLGLKARLAEVPVEIAVLKNEHELALQKLKDSFELDKVKLENEHKEIIQSVYENPVKEFDTLNKNVIKVKDDLTLGLEVFKSEVDAKKAKIAEGVAVAKEKADSELSSIKATLEKAEDNCKLEVLDLEKTHLRQMDDLKYNHSQAIKLQNEATFKTLASVLGKAVVGIDELETLRSSNEKEIKDIQAKAEIARNSAIKSVKEELTKELITQKHASDLETAKLNSEVTLLNAQIKQLTERNTALETQVATIPNTIKDALAASKADINIDATKK